MKKITATILLSTMLLANTSALAVEFEGYENENALSMTQIAKYTSGDYNFDGGVMEIISYNPVNQNAYAINGQKGVLAIIPLNVLANNTGFETLGGIDFDVKATIEAKDSTFTYGDMTSISISKDGKTLAVSLQANGYNDSGRVALFTCNADGSLTYKEMFSVGVQPDMVTYANENLILTANEGEPRMGYGDDIIDPKGTISIIDLTQNNVTELDFTDFDDKIEMLTSAGILMNKDGKPSTDLEPEYISISGDKAYVSLQEANAVATVNLTSKTIESVNSIGFTDFSEVLVDLEKKDETYTPTNYENLFGIRMPDAIATFEANGKTYVVTANEGDGREWGEGDYAFDNESKIDMSEENSPMGNIKMGEIEGKVTYLDPTVTSGVSENTDYLYGSRSFTILEITETGLTEVFDSGSEFEELTFGYLPDYFNVSNDNNFIDDRSSSKGPEPETVVVGEIADKIYAFIALERIGGVMMYDITTPENSTFVNYINTRDFETIVKGSEEYDEGELDKFVTGGDVAPEGMAFVSAENSPNGNNLLLTSNEVSGTISIIQIGGENSVSEIKLTRQDVWEILTGKASSDAKNYALSNGISDGTNENAIATEEEIITMIYRMYGEKATTSSNIEVSPWAKDAVDWAVENKVSDTNLSESVTYIELLEMILSANR